MKIEYEDCSDTLFLDYAYVLLKLKVENIDKRMLLLFKPKKVKPVDPDTDWENIISIEPDFLLMNRILRFEDWFRWPELEELLHKTITNDIKTALFEALKNKTLPTRGRLFIQDSGIPLTVEEYLEKNIPSHIRNFLNKNVLNKLIKSYEQMYQRLIINFFA